MSYEFGSIIALVCNVCVHVYMYILGQSHSDHEL